jgi:hypothetical protein
MVGTGLDWVYRLAYEAKTLRSTFFLLGKLLCANLEPKCHSACLGLMNEKAADEYMHAMI